MAHRQIRISVSVQVADGNSKWLFVRFKWRSLRFFECALAIGEKNRHISAFEISGDQICSAVFVQIGRAQFVIRHLADGKRNARGKEPTSAVVEDHGYAVVLPIVSRQIGLPITIEVSYHDTVRMWLALDREWRAGRGTETASTVSGQYGQI